MSPFNVERALSRPFGGGDSVAIVEIGVVVPEPKQVSMSA